MALLTLERSASIASFEEESDSDSTEVDDSVSELSASDSFTSSRGKLGRLRSPSFEGYFASRGGAISISHESPSKQVTDWQCGELQLHLQAIVSQLRDNDVLKMALRLESANPGKKRYLALISSDKDESVILGFNWDVGPTIALVLPIYNATLVQLDGDGGFLLTHPEIRKYGFKPVSVQTLWSANHILQRAIELAQQKNYFCKGSSHSFLPYYREKLVVKESLATEWNEIPDVSINMNFFTTFADNKEDEIMYKLIRNKLKEVMMSVDLDVTTCRMLREKCEEELNMDLRDYKAYLDKEMMYVMGQMDAASQILDYVYLGSEWNASNLEEILEYGIGYILNCTKEVDNFFPDRFIYYNISVLDEETTELLRYWDYTYRFINQAVEANSKILVHCRRGISRSASTVVAYIMKEFGWTLSKSLEFTKAKRNVVQPNSGFMKQLIIYEGMLNSSRNRYNALFVPPSSPERPVTPIRDKRKVLLEMRSVSAASDADDEDCAGEDESPPLVTVPSGGGAIPRNEDTPPDVEVNVDTKEQVTEADDDTDIRSEDVLSTDDGESTPMVTTPKRPHPTSLPIDILSSSEHNLDMADGVNNAKIKRTMRMQRRQTEAGLDSLTDAAVNKNQKHIMKEAMRVLERRSHMLQSLESFQVERGTRCRLDREFTVENTIKPSHLRRLSLGDRSLAHSQTVDEIELESRTKLFKDKVEPHVEPPQEIDSDSSDISEAFLRRSHFNIREDSRRRTFDESKFGAGEYLRSYDVEDDNFEVLKQPEDETVILTSQFRTVKDSKEWLEQFAKEPIRKPRSPRRRTVGITSISHESTSEPLNTVTDRISQGALNLEAEGRTSSPGGSRLLCGGPPGRLTKSAERLATLEDCSIEDSTGVDDVENIPRDDPDAFTSEAIECRDRRAMSESLLKSDQLRKDEEHRMDEEFSDVEIHVSKRCQTFSGGSVSHGFVQERIQNFLSSNTTHDKIKRNKSFPGAGFQLEEHEVSPKVDSSSDSNPVTIHTPYPDQTDSIKKAESDVFLSVSPSEKAENDVRFLVDRYENPSTTLPENCQTLDTLTSCCGEEIPTN